MNDRLQEIKEKIRTINPAITDELLELLCEYVKEANTPKGGGSPSHDAYYAYHCPYDSISYRNWTGSSYPPYQTYGGSGGSSKNPTISQCLSDETSNIREFLSGSQFSLANYDY